MTLKLVGHAGAICTKRVIITLHELNVPYELIPIDLLKGEQKQPEFLKHNPFGKIPYIDDDGFVLYESRAIAKYLSRKYGKEGNRLMPEKDDILGLARFEQAASVEQETYAKPTLAIALEYIGATLQERQVSQELLTKESSELEKVLETYDKILSEQKYTAGSDFSLIDIFHMPTGDFTRKAGAAEVFAKYPNVERWWNDITTRDSAKALNAPWP